METGHGRLCPVSIMILCNPLDKSGKYNTILNMDKTNKSGGGFCSKIKKF